jgi:hypothetical protein
MLNQLEFHFPRANPWGFTLASGMLMTGLQEVDWSKLTGLRRPSPHTIETSRPMPVLGLTVLLLVVPSLPALSLTVHGTPMSLMLQVEEDWDGFRNISWFTTTALTWDASLRVPLLSANRFMDEPFLEIYDIELEVHGSMEILCTYPCTPSYI